MTKQQVAMWFLAASLRPTMNVLAGKVWQGLEHLPHDRGAIICANHATNIDPMLVGHMLYSNGIDPHFLAKASLFRLPIAGKVLATAQHIPVDRAGVGAGISLKTAQAVLAAGKAVVIFPEGTLTKDPDLWPMQGHIGAARLAYATGATVIPLAHWGAQDVWPRNAKFPRPLPRKKVVVRVGPPVDLSMLQHTPLTKRLLQRATEKILDDITGLVADLRGAPPPEPRRSTTVAAEQGHEQIASEQTGREQ